MRVLSYDSEFCVGCYACEEICSETYRKKLDPERPNIHIHSEGDGQFSAVYCVQCGECIEVCPTKALYRDKRGIVRLRKKLCVGCLSCVGVCPYEAMFYHPDLTEPFNCIACGLCARECPAEALEVVEVDTSRAPGVQA